MKIGLVFGSTTGNTHDIAESIQERLSSHIDECLDIDAVELDDLTKFDVLLVGIPTWDVGGLQDSWEYKIGEVEKLSFEGTQVAFFGEGDQSGYPENYQDAMGIVREVFVARGAKAEIGHWENDDYDFEESKALIGDKFCGLALDTLNQDDLTEERIEKWCVQLETELNLN